MLTPCNTWEGILDVHDTHTTGYIEFMYNFPDSHD